MERSNPRNKYLQALRREWVGRREKGLTVSRSHVEFAVKGRCWEATAAVSELRVNVRCVGQVALSLPEFSRPQAHACPPRIFGKEPSAANMSVILHINLSHVAPTRRDLRDIFCHDYILKDNHVYWKPLVCMPISKCDIEWPKVLSRCHSDRTFSTSAK